MDESGKLIAIIGDEVRQAEREKGRGTWSEEMSLVLFVLYVTQRTASDAAVAAAVPAVPSTPLLRNDRPLQQIYAALNLDDAMRFFSSTYNCKVVLCRTSISGKLLLLQQQQPRCELVSLKRDRSGKQLISREGKRPANRANTRRDSRVWKRGKRLPPSRYTRKVQVFDVWMCLAFVSHVSHSEEPVLKGVYYN